MFNKENIQNDDKFLTSLYTWYFSFEMDQFIDFVNSDNDFVNKFSFFRVEKSPELVEALTKIHDKWYVYDFEKYETVFDQFLDFVECAQDELEPVMEVSQDFFHDYFKHLFEYKDVEFVNNFLKASELTKEEYMDLKQDFEDINSWNNTLFDAVQDNPVDYSIEKFEEHDAYLRSKEKVLQAIWAWAEFEENSLISSWDKEFEEELAAKDKEANCKAGYSCKHHS